MSSWNHLIRGRHMYKLNPEMSVYDESYYRDEFYEIKEKYDDYMSYLSDNISQIEYIDPLETEGFLIAKSINSIDKDYTHCDIRLH